MEQKITKLQKSMALAGLDALFVTNAANIFYLTGLANFDSEKGFLLAVTADDWKIISSRFYQSRIDAVIPAGNTLYVERGGSISRNTADFFGGRRNIGFERENISYAQYEVFKKLLRGRKLIPSTSIIEQMRRIKDETELAFIAKAARITDKAFAEVIKLIKPGVTELSLKRKIVEMMQDMGAQGGSFEPIVASGRNAADPHYEGSNKRIKSGEMVVFDLGARYNNYDADMTRMVFMGKAPAKYKELYRIVLETQEKALKDCVFGAPVKLAYDNCVANFSRYGQDQYFTHGLGHGVGIDIHEEPSLSPGGQGNFEDGMVFTVEPGLYHPGWGGIRIEDLCAMRNGKLVILSRTKKHLFEV